MSNEVYGYLEFPRKNKDLNFEGVVHDNTKLGAFTIDTSELFNFPESTLPSNEGNVWCFLLGDKQGKRNATYLLDDLDYEPNADIGFPVEATKRFSILANSITTIIKLTEPEKFFIALTDSSQIEELKRVPLSHLYSTIVSDCLESSPPDFLYEVMLKE